jgi:4-hydroxybenzoate polyprenyltransferase
MKWLKFILLLVALGLGAYFLLWLIGVIYGLLSYIFWIGLLAIGGTVGYKLFLSGDSRDEKPKLEEKKPIAISEFDEADRALEEMKRKYLPEERR